MKAQLIGINKAIKNLSKTSKELKNNPSKTTKDIAEWGLTLAQSNAPEYSGALKTAMHFEEEGEDWLIISSPAPSDKGFPVNVAFEKGQFGNMTMYGPGGTRVPFRPRDSNTIGFMFNTAVILQREFARRMGITVTHAIEEV